MANTTEHQSIINHIDQVVEKLSQQQYLDLLSSVIDDLVIRREAVAEELDLDETF